MKPQVSAVQVSQQPLNSNPNRLVGFTARQIWSRAFVILVVFWLLVGDLLGQVSTSYAADLAQLATLQNGQSDPTGLAGLSPDLAFTSGDITLSDSAPTLAKF